MKKRNAILSLLLGGVMLISNSAFAVEVQTFPEVPESYAQAVDPTAPLKTIYSGAYRVDVPIEGSEAERTALVYLAEGYSQTQGFIMVVPDSGMTAEQALEEGGWQAVADENNLYLMILEPSEGAYDDDAYISAAAQLADSRDYWRQPEGRNYIVAYGDAADLATKFAEETLPSTWAGLAVFGDLSISAADITNNNGTELPVWLFATDRENDSEVIDLLKEYNDSADHAYSDENADEIYFPDQHTASLLLNEQPMSQVRVTVTEDAAALNAERAAYVYDFLKEGTREVGYGDKTMRYTHDLEDWGATVESVEVDGITRSWIQYVPSSLKETAEGKAPLLVAIHGAALNGEYFAERTEYIKLAEEYGFIVVFPTGSLNNGITPAWNPNPEEGQWDDVKFISDMLDTVKEKLPVDASRIYVYGHSMGGLFTQNLINKLDGVFAAAFGTGCSFAYPGEIEHKYETPISIMVGNTDYIAPHGIDNEKLRDCLNYHIENENCGTIDDVDGVYRTGRFTTYVWENDEHVPMVEYIHAEDLPHTATLDGGMMMFEWLSQFSRGEDGSVEYRAGSYNVQQ